MNLTLTITGSAVALARVLAALDDAALIAPSNEPPAPVADHTITAHAPQPPAPVMPQITMPAAPAMPSPLAQHLAPVAAALATADDDDGPANPAAPLTDKTGLPWDERIHAKNKGINADGTWRKRKGIDAAIYAQIEAQLRGAAPQPVAVTVPVPTATPVAMPTPQPLAVPAAQPVPVPVMPEVVAAAPVPITDFAGFMAALQTAMQQPIAPGQLEWSQYLQTVIARTNEAYAPHGVAIQSVTDVQMRPDMIPYIVQVMQLDGRFPA